MVSPRSNKRKNVRDPSPIKVGSVEYNGVFQVPSFFSVPYPWEVRRELWVACPWVEGAYQEEAVPSTEMILVEQELEAP